MDQKDFSVSKVAEYSSNHSQNMKNAMSVLNFNTNWQNRFAEYEGAINFLSDEYIAIKKKLIDLDNVPLSKKDLISFDFTRYFNIKAIWEGQCYFTRERDPFYHTQFIPGSARFHYDTSKIDFKNKYLEITPLPSLDDMTPVGRIKEKTLLIEVTTNVPLYLAYESMDFETLIREGGLYHIEGGKLRAKFSPTDMHSKVIFTYKLGRSYYFKTLNILKRKFMENWSHLKVDLHQILVYKELQEQIFDVDFLQHLTGQSTGTPQQDANVEEIEDGDRPYDPQSTTPEVATEPLVIPKIQPTIDTNPLKNLSKDFIKQFKEKYAPETTKSKQEIDREYYRKMEEDYNKRMIPLVRT